MPALSRQPRWAAATCVALAVLGLHLAMWREGAALARLGATAVPPRAPPVRAVDVRSLAATPPDVRAQAEPMTTAHAVPLPAPLPASAVRLSPSSTAALPRSVPLQAAPELLAVPTPQTLAQVPGTLPAPSMPQEPAETAPTALPAPPVYATRLPTPGRWHYRMQRGSANGEAELHFELVASEAGDGPGYTLALTARAAGAPPIDWASRGHLDVAGLAPERFALRRKGRDRQAANFQREAGKITFSGPTHAHPLPAGAQDRLSWLLQLTAIVAAAPESYGEGSQVQIYVAGARGDAQVWVFVVEGRESMADGSSLVKLVREPVRLYDTRAEVWLDPQRQFLPQRLLQTPQGGGPALDLTYEPRPI